MTSGRIRLPQLFRKVSIGAAAGFTKRPDNMTNSGMANKKIISPEGSETPG